MAIEAASQVPEQHGGRVFVQSQVNEGSIFGMIFPVMTPQPNHDR